LTSARYRRSCASTTRHTRSFGRGVVSTWLSRHSADRVASPRTIAARRREVGGPTSAPRIARGRRIPRLKSAMTGANAFRQLSVGAPEIRCARRASWFTRGTTVRSTRRAPGNRTSTGGRS
jgi:hypothetical protein